MQTAPAAPTEAQRVERARAALAPLKAGLKGALTEAMEEGPDAAIAACQQKAPAISARAAAAGLRLGRTSHRLRNPDNAPEPWMQPLLERYLAGESATHLTAELADGALGYVEPIRIEALCLNCHGETLTEPVQARLAELYPEDRATGFADGDLRGLFWAVVPPGS